MRDVTQMKSGEMIIFTACNTKGSAWMRNYYGSRSVSFRFDEFAQIMAFRRALSEDGVMLSAL